MAAQSNPRRTHTETHTNQLSRRSSTTPERKYSPFGALHYRISGATSPASIFSRKEKTRALRASHSHGQLNEPRSRYAPQSTYSGADQ